MKKIIALILTLVVLTALLTVPAMAEETISIDFEGVGVTLEVPQAFQETKGVLDAGDGNERWVIIPAGIIWKWTTLPCRWTNTSI